jgi:hypothetical protein
VESEQRRGWILGMGLLALIAAAVTAPGAAARRFNKPVYYQVNDQPDWQDLLDFSRTPYPYTSPISEETHVRERVHFGTPPASKSTQPGTNTAAWFTFIAPNPAF